MTEEVNNMLNPFANVTDSFRRLHDWPGVKWSVSGDQFPTTHGKNRRTSQERTSRSNRWNSVFCARSVEHDMPGN